jgi:hypothetical protein
MSFYWHRCDALTELIHKLSVLTEFDWMKLVVIFPAYPMNL